MSPTPQSLTISKRINLRKFHSVPIQFHELQLKASHSFVYRKKYIRTYTGNIGRARISATPKMELLVTIVNDFQPLTITTESFIPGNAAVLDPRLGNVF